MPEALIGAFGNLKHLDLTSTDSLGEVAPKVISSLSSLEELYMEVSFAVWEVGGNEDVSNAYFSEVSLLSHLTVLRVAVMNKNCMSVDVLGFLRNVKSFSISFGDRFRFSEINASRRLGINAAVIAIPDLAADLISMTEELILRDCKGLKNLFQLYGGGLTLDESFNCISESSRSRIQVSEDHINVVEDEALQNADRRLKHHTFKTTLCCQKCVSFPYSAVKN